MRRDDKIERLAAVPLFSECSKRDLAAVARLSQEVSLPAGHTLIREGAEAFSFFVLLEGTADVRRGGRRVATLERGDFFGELALILRSPRTATVTLTSPTRLLTVSAHTFQPLLIEMPKLQFKILEALTRRFAPAAT